MSEMTLKECPFCGGKASGERIGRKMHFIECIECSASSDIAFKESLAAYSWNTRTPNSLIAKQQRMIEMAMEALIHYQAADDVKFKADAAASGVFNVTTNPYSFARKALAALSEAEKDL